MNENTPQTNHRAQIGGAKRTLPSGRSERLFHTLFDISIIAKGIDGALEIVAGVLLFFISPERLHHIATILTQHELTEDPQDVVANYLLTSSQHMSVAVKTFGAIYLLWHGIVKVGLVTALLLRKTWAYPVAIASFLLFLVYQLYRYSHTQSMEMLFLSVLDVFVIALTWLEYKRLRGHLGPGPSVDSS